MCDCICVYASAFSARLLAFRIAVHPPLWRAQACRHTALSLAAKSKIESSTIESSRGDGAKAVQKRRLQIWITRGPKFEEHRAEVRAPWRFPLLRASL